MRGQWSKPNLRYISFFLDILLNTQSIKTLIWPTSCAHSTPLNEIKLTVTYIYVYAKAQYEQFCQLASASIQRYPIICKLSLQMQKKVYLNMIWERRGKFWWAIKFLSTEEMGWQNIHWRVLCSERTKDASKLLKICHFQLVRSIFNKESKNHGLERLRKPSQYLMLILTYRCSLGAYAWQVVSPWCNFWARN